MEGHNAGRAPFQEEDYGRKSRVPPEAEDSSEEEAGMPEALRRGLRLQEDGAACGT